MATTTPVTAVAPAPVHAAPVQAVPVAQTVQAPAPSLTDQLGQVDPIIWAAIAGVLVIPWLMQGLKKVGKWLGKTLEDKAAYTLTGALSGATSLLIDTITNGKLDQLHNPLLQLLLTSLIVFVTGTSTYQLILKKKLVDPTPDNQLPVLDPA